MAAVPRETHPATAYDFSGLTLTQQWLLTYQGWEPGSKLMKQPRPQSVRKLIERGLVVERPVIFMGIRIKAYDVPLPVHMAWCMSQPAPKAEP